MDKYEISLVQTRRISPWEGSLFCESMDTRESMVLPQEYNEGVLPGDKMDERNQGQI